MLFQKGIVGSTLLAMELMSVENGGKGGIVLNAILTGDKKQFQECPFFVGVQHFLMGFAKSMSLSCYEKTCVRIVTLCVVGHNIQSHTWVYSPAFSVFIIYSFNLGKILPHFVGKKVMLD